MTSPQPAQEPPEIVRMREMLGGYRITQMLYVAAKLGLPDLLVDGPKSAQELAIAASAHGPSLYRLLRALASTGVFAERSDGRFESTALSDRLRSDAPDSQRAFALSYGEPWWWSPFGELLHSVKTGETAFNRIYGTGMFEYLGRHADAARIFNENMTASTRGAGEAVASAYNFSRFKVLVDVGGGHGAFAAGILRRNPQLRAVIFDQQTVLEGAAPVLEGQGVLARCVLSPGDFFESVPAGGDLYVLKYVIHDWDDAKAAQILRNVRRAMRPDGRLLLVESMISAGNEASRGKLVDLTMLVFTGGRERTEPEYAKLLQGAGLRLDRTIPLAGATSVLEALPI